MVEIGDVIHVVRPAGEYIGQVVNKKQYSLEAHQILVHPHPPKRTATTWTTDTVYDFDFVSVIGKITDPDIEEKSRWALGCNCHLEAEDG